MKLVRVRVRETSEVIHLIEVEDDFKLPDAENIDDLANQIGEQNSEPIEVLDVQIESVLSAELMTVN